MVWTLSVPVVFTLPGSSPVLQDLLLGTQKEEERVVVRGPVYDVTRWGPAHHFTVYPTGTSLIGRPLPFVLPHGVLGVILTRSSGTRSVGIGGYRWVVLKAHTVESRLLLG